MGLFSLSKKHKKSASSVSQEETSSPPASPSSSTAISSSQQHQSANHIRADSSPLRVGKNGAVLDESVDSKSLPQTAKRLPLPPSNVSTTPLPPTPHAEDTSRIYSFTSSETSSPTSAANPDAFRGQNVHPTGASIQERPREEAMLDGRRDADFLPAQKFDEFVVPIPASRSAGGAGVNELASQLRKAEISDSRRIANAPGDLPEVGLAADSVMGAAPDSTLRAGPQSSTAKAVGAGAAAGRDSLPVNSAAGPAASTPATHRAVDTVEVPSHHQQQLALLEKIRKNHHPVSARLDPAGRELFQTAGMPPVDLEGQGTVDWEEEWGTPIVKETVFRNQHVEYQTQIEINRHVHHVYQKVQPLLQPPSVLPEDELHYFQDAQGNWREVRGRALAEEILGSLSASERALDQPYEYWDSRAVEAEWKEMRDLVETGKQEYETVIIKKKMGTRALMLGEAEELLQDLKFWKKDEDKNLSVGSNVKREGEQGTRTAAVGQAI
ncbi:hypothetical protein [Phaffia rhodozyma]|uniref:Uncharacterized protein n=1 Tax=Phaffia rhodozyma TaxID=264483 RepID=A0A0F7SSM6_PHARH|nr:hypothetical protein [Phaffia rhodozyma]